MNSTDVSNPTIYTHCGITAPLTLWQAVGLNEVTWVGGKVEFPRRNQGGGFNPQSEGATDAELIEARIVTGDTGEKAMIWLIAERRRQAEERARNQAAQITAQAQKKAGDDAIHAARIHRQAEELRCLAAGVSKASINSRLE